MARKRIWLTAAAVLLAGTLSACSGNGKKETAEPTEETETTEAADKQEEQKISVWPDNYQDRVSVHDPSVRYVVDEAGERTYYIFGSHVAQAKSRDLISWAPAFSMEYEDPDHNIIYGNICENLAESFLWAGYDDADCKGGYAIWAPDVIWNEDYAWDNGDKGAYMLYYSASSTWRRSCIGFAVSANIEGPYEYGGTVIYSGFTYEDSTDGSDRNTNYVNTNLNTLIEEGTISEFNDEWATGGGATYNTDYAPNAIDPAMFYDEDGKLWMTYGSWSGGIFLLELDKETGMPLYPGEDSETEDGRVIDRYFGIKLMGGYHQSGEGPYIVYDESNGYYYLFVTYGGLLSDGGYNMRLFRAEAPEGPYVDAQGNTAIFGPKDNNWEYGIKVMGNYILNGIPKAYMAPGHNSAFIDEDGQWYLVYHTRFDDGNEGHEVRVHQMFMNDEGWPVTAVYEYAGDEISTDIYEQEMLTGTYQYLNHGIGYSGHITESQSIELESDGSISGDVEGGWEMTEGNNVRIVLDDVVYSGVFFEQSDEGKEKENVMTFTAIGENNETIWGSK